MKDDPLQALVAASDHVWSEKFDPKIKKHYRVTNRCFQEESYARTVLLPVIID